MTISFGNTQISLEDGNTAAAPQASTPAPAKKGHRKAITGVLLLAGLGAAGYIAAGGVSGIQGMVNGASAAGKTVDTIDNINKKAVDAIGNVNEKLGNIREKLGNEDRLLIDPKSIDRLRIDPELKDKAKKAAMIKGAMAGRKAAINGGGKLMQKAAGAASLFIPN